MSAQPLATNRPSARTSVLSLLYPNLQTDYVWLPKRLIQAFCTDRTGIIGLFLVIARLWQRLHRLHPDGIPISHTDLMTFCGFSSRGAFLAARKQLVDGGWIVIRSDHYKTWYKPAWGKRRNGDIPTWKSSKEKYGRIVGRSRIETERVACALVDVYMGSLIPNGSRPAAIRRWTTQPATVKTISAYVLALHRYQPHTHAHHEMQTIGLMDADGQVHATNHQQALDALRAADLLNDDGQHRVIALGLAEKPNQKNAVFTPHFAWHSALILTLIGTLIGFFQQQDGDFTASEPAKTDEAIEQENRRSMSLTPSNHDLLSENDQQQQKGLKEDLEHQENGIGNHEAEKESQTPNSKIFPTESDTIHNLVAIHNVGIWQARRYAKYLSAEVIEEVVAEMQRRGRSITKPGGWLTTVLAQVQQEGIEKVRAQWKQWQDPDKAPFDHEAFLSIAKASGMFQSDEQPQQPEEHRHIGSDEIIKADFGTSHEAFEPKAHTADDWTHIIRTALQNTLGSKAREHLPRLRFALPTPEQGYVLASTITTKTYLENHAIGIIKRTLSDYGWHGKIMYMLGH